MLFSELCTYFWQSCWLEKAHEHQEKTDQEEFAGLHGCVQSYFSLLLHLPLFIFSSWPVYIQKLSMTSLLELWTKCPFCISFMLMKMCSFPRQTSGWILHFQPGPLDGCQDSWFLLFLPLSPLLDSISGSCSLKPSCFLWGFFAAMCPVCFIFSHHESSLIGFICNKLKKTLLCCWIKTLSIILSSVQTNTPAMPEILCDYSVLS